MTVVPYFITDRMSNFYPVATPPLIARHEKNQRCTRTDGALAARRTTFANVHEFQQAKRKAGSGARLRAAWLVWPSITKMEVACRIEEVCVVVVVVISGCGEFSSSVHLPSFPE